MCFAININKGVTSVRTLLQLHRNRSNIFRPFSSFSILILPFLFHSQAGQLSISKGDQSSSTFLYSCCKCTICLILFHRHGNSLDTRIIYDSTQCVIIIFIRAIRYVFRHIICKGNSICTFIWTDVVISVGDIRKHNGSISAVIAGGDNSICSAFLHRKSKLIRLQIPVFQGLGTGKSRHSVNALNSINEVNTCVAIYSIG